ncbi:hypothetical protein [Paenibacillus thalictri]|uniref:Uncharacterized protein n=1 Tax=Paenibacillus thalictri TaxID=2527873 RepID=A0A4Q9DW78_9BACL|nr:hypothetical protein [Paenibacillus thalictri]TBL81289.1 hypothetical protein EYB31_04165 [Paenibacillus thalictri]
MNYGFVLDERLGIPLPELHLEWEEYAEAERSAILLRWEEIRGTIPDRIMAIERVIVVKQSQLSMEENFALSCQLNSEIAELASTINELHIWFRINQDIAPGAAHH